MALITLAEAKQTLNDTSTDNDDELQAYIDAATAVVERELGRIVDSRQFTEEMTVPADTTASAVQLSSVPVINLVSVQSIDGSTTWNVADLHVNKATGLVTVQNGDQFNGTVVFTYTAGYVDIPGNYRMAGRHVVYDLWASTQRGAMDVTTEGLNETLSFVGRGYLVPRFVKGLLGTTLPGIA